MRRTVGHSLPLAALVLAAGCGFSKMQSSAPAGPAPGGILSGSATGPTVRGAIIGAGVGGAAGGVINQQMDSQARELAGEMLGVTVQRVGEGITLIFPEGSLFDNDSDLLLQAASDDLQRLASSLAKYGNTRAMIVGHTDTPGAADQGDLSARRALSVANFLETAGVARGRIGTAGRGKTEPVASNDTEAGRRQNRRVEMAIYTDQSSAGSK